MHMHAEPVIDARSNGHAYGGPPQAIRAGDRRGEERQRARVRVSTEIHVHCMHTCMYALKQEKNKQ